MLLEGVPGVASNEEELDIVSSAGSVPSAMNFLRASSSLSDAAEKDIDSSSMGSTSTAYGAASCVAPPLDKVDRKPSKSGISLLVETGGKSMPTSLTRSLGERRLLMVLTWRSSDLAVCQNTFM